MSGCQLAARRRYARRTSAASAPMQMPSVACGDPAGAGPYASSRRGNVRGDHPRKHYSDTGTAADAGSTSPFRDGWLMSFAAAEAAWDDSCLAGSVKARVREATGGRPGCWPRCRSAPAAAASRRGSSPGALGSRAATCCSASRASCDRPACCSTCAGECCGGGAEGLRQQPDSWWARKGGRVHCKAHCREGKKA